jgi:hypothetical protein
MCLQQLSREAIWGIVRVDSARAQERCNANGGPSDRSFPHMHDAKLDLQDLIKAEIIA